MFNIYNTTAINALDHVLRDLMRCNLLSDGCARLWLRCPVHTTPQLFSNSSNTEDSESSASLLYYTTIVLLKYYVLLLGGIAESNSDPTIVTFVTARGLSVCMYVCMSAPC